MIVNSIKGKTNEYLFVNRLNNKKKGELSFTLQLLIEDLFSDVSGEDMIKAWKSTFLTKTDMYIKIKNKLVRVSVKKGVKNSVHAESLSNFIIFLKKLGISEEIIKIYILYHYGDGTLDGSGDRRISSGLFKSKYQKQIDIFNEYLNQQEIVNKVVDRFIIRGRNGTDRVNIILYGTPEDFIWIKREDIYKLFQNRKNEYSTGPHCSRLSIQPFNRCLNNNSKYEDCRHIVQIKWYNIYDDILEYNSRIKKE